MRTASYEVILTILSYDKLADSKEKVPYIFKTVVEVDLDELSDNEELENDLLMYALAECTGMHNITVVDCEFDYNLVRE